MKIFKNTLKGTLLFGFLILLSTSGTLKAQTIQVSGPNALEVNQSGTYSISTSSSNILWTIFGGGQINSGQGTPNINVTATTGANFTVQVQLDGGSGGFGGKEVSVTPQVPATPTSSTSNCEVVLTRGTPPTGVTWYWQGTTSNGTNADPSNTSVTYTVNTSGTYYLRARNNDGNWSVSSAGKSVTMPTVPAQPSFTTNSTHEICPGQQTTFTISNPISGGAYRWYKNGVQQATGTSFNVSPSQSTTYTVKVTSSAGCESAASTLNVEVLDLPEPIPDHGQNTCLSNEVTVSAFNTKTVNGVVRTDMTHVWYSDSGGTNIVSFDPVPGTPSGTLATQKTLTITNGQTVSFWVATKVGSCMTTLTQVNATYMDFTLSGGTVGETPAVCYNGNPGNLQSLALPSGGSGSYTYQWKSAPANSGPWTPVSNGTSASYNPPANQTTTKWYHRVASSCGSSATSNAVEVIVYPQVPPPAISNQSDCGPTSFNLTATGAPVGASYRWYDSNAVLIPNQTSSSLSTGTLNTTTTYQVSIVNNGCEGPKSFVTAEIKPLPVAPTTQGGSNSCDDTITVYAFSDPGSTTSHIWYTDSLQNTQVQPTIVSEVGQYTTSYTVTAESRSFWVAVQNADGCISDRTEVIADYSAVNDPRTLNVRDDSPINMDICGNATFNLTATGGEEGSEYRWYNSLTETTPFYTGGSFSPSLTYIDMDTNGEKTYYVDATLINSYGCSSETPERIWIKVRVNPVPEEATGQGQSQCGTSTFTLSATPGDHGNTIRWYDSNQQYLTTALQYTTPGPISETTVFYAESYNMDTGCFSSQKTAVTATVTNAISWYLDADGDGYAASTTADCSNPGPGYTQTVLPLTDCNDNNENINPDTIWYEDADGDNLGDSTSPSTPQCTAPTGYVLSSNDNCPGVSDPTNSCVAPPDPSEKNYVYTRSYQNESATPIDPAFFTSNDNLIQGITYFDGLGRPIQQTAISQSPTHNDIITHMDYDPFGRLEKEYLPYASVDSQVATYRTSALSETLGFYDDLKYDSTANPYSQKDFEASPLNRVKRQAAPGASWTMDSGNEIKIDYETSTVADGVRHFEVSLVLTDSIFIPTLEWDNTVYGDSTLYKTVTKDENWKPADEKNRTVEEFTDLQGRVILKRTYADIDNNLDGDMIDAGEQQVAHDTYYVYDDHGNLSYVLPPEMGASTESLANLNAGMANLGYRYVYDQRNRMVIKQIPGKGPEHIIYNKLDQPVMTQDSIRRIQNEWLFTKYDRFGRVAYTGKVTDTGGRYAIQNTVNGLTSELWVNQSGTASAIGSGSDTVYYNNGAYPTSGITEILTINYYDNYETNRSGTAESVTSFGVASTDAVRGLVTESRVKVLEVSPTKWITTVTYYDKKARPIYAYSGNGYLGTVDVVASQLDFTGRVLKTRSSHTRGSTTITTLDNFTYDHAGRLVAQTQCIGDETLGDDCGGTSVQAYLELTETVTAPRTDIARDSIVFKPNFHVVATGSLSYTAKIDPNATTTGGDQELIVLNTYDELGLLESKKVGGDVSTVVEDSPGLQTVDYAYNVRGWLRQINNPASLGSDLFGFKINYDNVSHGATALFNGNISETEWKTQNDNTLRWYSYGYDALNRISMAGSSDGKFDLGSASQPVTYDKNGNIQRLFRKGHVVANPTYSTASHYGTMDNLVYEYIGNQLQKVTDQSLVIQGFNDQYTSTEDYRYDPNGNLLMDRNKFIGDETTDGIAYNHLNLPVEITFSGGGNSGTIDYIYDATGIKLQKVVNDTGLSSVTTTDYAGNFIYEDTGSGPILQFFNHPEGYVTPDGSGGYDYVYQYKDHLGNIRLSYTDANNDGQITVSPDPMVTEIVEENNYYPFGLQHKGYNNVINGTENNYKTFQGQEHEKELGKETYAFQWRDYDPAIARFNKIDRFAEKYYDKTPYHFSANNPIRFTEIAGDSIWINYKDEKIRYEDGNLYNRDGTAYSGKGLKTGKDGSTKLKGFLGKAVSALNAISSGGDSGNELVGDLQDSEQHVFIGKGSNNTNGLRVSWNPSDKSGGPDQTGGTGRPSFVGLAHELGHAYDALDGVIDRSTWVTTSAGKAIPNAEIYASHWENRIRGENGLSLRTHYAIDKGTNLGSLLNSNGASSHFSRSQTMPTIQFQTQGNSVDGTFRIVPVPGSSTMVLPYKYD